MAIQKKRSTNCLNCDQPLHHAYAYCPQCGQENHDLHVPAKHLLLELVEGVLHFDAKFFQTARLLLFAPGALTAAYNEGRRTRFVPPVRMYIFISFVFFLLLSVQKDHTKKEEARASVVLTVPAQAKPEETDFITQKIEKMKTDNFHSFKALMFRTMSYMMFVLMPFAALLISWLYRSQGRFYIDHLVFSVHTHCFAFLLFSVYFMVEWIMPVDFLALAVFVLLIWYVFSALRRVYQERPSRTLFKMAALSAMYGVVLIIGFVSAVLISVVIA